MITLRKSQERGHTRLDWLDSRHTFSFDQYYDPAQMGFSSLRVLNQDRIAPGAGFPTHPHRNMEIISYVLEGALEHKDSLGNGSVIRPGEVQRMSAGTGVTHSEHNPSATEPAHFLQIWILPAQSGLAPSYEQKNFPQIQPTGRLCLVASPDARAGSLTIHQDAFLYVARLREGQSVKHVLAPDRKAYLHLARGRAQLNCQPLSAGDGARISEEKEINLTTDDAAEVLLFDLP